MPDHPLLADGYLDGHEVAAFLGSFADPDPDIALPWTEDPPGYPDPSFWVGYGGLHDAQWSALLGVWDGPFPALRTPGPGHQLNLDIRALLEETTVVHTTTCDATGLVTTGTCLHHHSGRDDWYR